jgi:8-oxo-dGTP pyrophosphatase MutT (NUDIX family)
MSHLHEKIDFTVAIFVVHDEKILLIHHCQLDQWLPLGGHIELDEDPEQAALREAKEESGLAVELLGERPPTTGPGTRALIAPRFLDIHRINDTHQHIGMMYWARPKVGSARCADRTPQRGVPTNKFKAAPGNGAAFLFRVHPRIAAASDSIAPQSGERAGATGFDLEKDRAPHPDPLLLWEGEGENRAMYGCTLLFQTGE